MCIYAVSLFSQKCLRASLSHAINLIVIKFMNSISFVIKHSDNESEIFEYYLLDCEGLGFCDYVRLENPTKEEAYMEEERLMGGLGENRVFISEDRALFLVQYFGQKNIEYDKPLPDGQEYYMDTIKNHKTNKI